MLIKIPIETVYFVKGNFELNLTSKSYLILKCIVLRENFKFFQ